MNRRPIAIENEDKASSRNNIVREEGHPPAEDDLGGGDICSVEDEPSTDDDKPLG